MLTETVELTMRHLGLGDLDEFALLTLFADVQARRLVEGTGKTLGDVVDAGGSSLYPAYYRTHVRVPAACPLSSFRLWTRATAGVDVRTFGGMLLESRYVLAPEDGVPESVEAWDTAALPTMEGSSMFIVDDLSRFPQASGPAEGTVAELDRVEAAPAAMPAFRKLRAGGSLGDEEIPREGEPARYRVEARRDAAGGHNMMFAQYVRIMDRAEAEMLGRVGGEVLPREIEAGLTTLERETFYFGNCQSGETVETWLRGTLVAAPADLPPAPEGMVFAGVLEWTGELHRAGDEPDRLAVSRCRKVLTLPAARGDLLDRARALVESPGAASIGSQT